MLQRLRRARSFTGINTQISRHQRPRNAAMRALLAVSALATSRALVAPNAARALRPSTRLHVFKEPTTPKPVEAPRRPKSKLRPRDPSLYMEPVPLVPDAEGNWEPLVSEIWTDVEKMSKLAETNFKAELSRFRDFCDHYRTARGTTTATAHARGLPMNVGPCMSGRISEEPGGAAQTLDATFSVARVAPIVI